MLRHLPKRSKLVLHSAEAVEIGARGGGAAGEELGGDVLDGARQRVVDLDELGGLVTKAVTPEPRVGNPALRVAEYGAGMMNSVGLANVGLDAFCAEKLPWLRDRLREALSQTEEIGRTVTSQPELLEQACQYASVPLELNMREGYDHSYYFIATFIERHIAHHARALLT